MVVVMVLNGKIVVVVMVLDRKVMVVVIEFKGKSCL